MEELSVGPYQYKMALLEMNYRNDAAFDIFWIMLALICAAIIGVIGLFGVFSKSPLIYAFWILLTIGSVIAIVLLNSYDVKNQNKFMFTRPSHQMHGLLVKDSELLVEDCRINWAQEWNDSTNSRKINNITLLGGKNAKRSLCPKHYLEMLIVYDNNPLIKSLRLEIKSMTISDGNELFYEINRHGKLWVLNGRDVKLLHLNKYSHIVKSIRLTAEAIKDSGVSNLEMKLFFATTANQASLDQLRYDPTGALYKNVTYWLSNRNLQKLVESEELRDPETNEDLVTVVERLGLDVFGIA